MGLLDRLAEKAARAFAGETIYSRPPMGPTLDDLEGVRRANGGQVQPRNLSKLEWYLADLHSAQYTADNGDMTLIGQLSTTMRRDGIIAGLRNTRSAGLLALPRSFLGDPDQVAALEATPTTRPLFDEMFPPAALAACLDDFIVTGLAVAERVPVLGRSYSVMTRRDPQFLRYRWHEDRWYYASIIGLVPITPGDGRWMLLLADRTTPWNFGCWAALGRAFITKEHALLGRANFSSKLANPAIIGYSPPAATEVDQLDWLDQLLAWGYNTVFQTPLGWDVKLLESNGRGWEVFGTDVEQAEREIIITLTGSTVMVDGGTGFANAGIHQAVRADLIEASGAPFAHWINTQGLAPWAMSNFGGVDALENLARVDWDIRPAALRKEEGEALKAFGEGVKAANEALAADGKELDMVRIANRYNLPTKARSGGKVDLLNSNGGGKPPGSNGDKPPSKSSE